MDAKRVYTVKPNKECPYCYGSGTVTDWEDNHIPMYSTCECVYDVLTNEHDAPGDNEDYTIILDLSDYDPTYKLNVREG